MLFAPTLDDVVKHAEKANAPLCGILLAPSFTETAKKQVIPRIAYLDHRTGSHIHFYCAGYGGYWHKSRVPDMQDIGSETYPNGTVIPWAFSQKAFAEFVNDLEANTKYQYSGESDLLLLSGRVDFSDTLFFNIDRMVSDEAISSASQLFELIIQHSRRQTDQRGFSDAMGLKMFSESIVEGIISLAPPPLQSLWKRGQHYAVRDLSKD